MFWGCFNAGRKGPGVFWEKDWGSITSQSYREHIIPVINNWIRQNETEGRHLFFMQDNVRAHYANATRADLQLRQI